MTVPVPGPQHRPTVTGGATADVPDAGPGLGRDAVRVTTVDPDPTTVAPGEQPGRRDGRVGAGGRARPLPPAERRAALIAATLPLVSRYGTKVTTRQIAEAAGVAEGTIFRVFPDKEALINEAIDAVLDPLPVLAELAAVDGDLPLPVRLTEIIQILQRRLTFITNLLVAVGRHHPPKDPDLHRKKADRRHAVVRDALQRALERDGEQFRFPVPEVVRLVHLLTFSATHPLLTEGEPMTAEQICSILLDGVLRRP